MVWVEIRTVALIYRVEMIIPHGVQIGQQFQLMHDNTAPQTARLVSAAIRKHDVTVLGWPLQSPDVNWLKSGCCTKGYQQFSVKFEHRIQTIFSFEKNMGPSLAAYPSETDADTLILSLNNSRRCVIIIKDRGNTDS